jgi:GAF domain
MKSYTIQLPCIELLAPDEIFENQDELKEYALSHWKDEVLRRLVIQRPTMSTSISSENGSLPTLAVAALSNHDERTTDAIVATCSSPPPFTVGPNPENQQRANKVPFQDGSMIISPNRSLKKKLDLLNTIARVQRQFFQSESPKVIFGTMLDALLNLLDSEYGFIGEVKYNEDGSKYLQTHAITNIAWDNVTRQFFEENIGNGLKFTNLHSLFGEVITTALPVISNDPKTDQRGCGIPKGHPPLDHFLGVPFFMPGGEMNGMVGISNKPGGYKEDDIEFLEVR